MRLDRLTTKTREALAGAQQEATKRGNPELYPEHLLLALLAQPEGVAAPKPDAGKGAGPAAGKRKPRNTKQPK